MRKVQTAIRILNIFVAGLSFFLSYYLMCIYTSLTLAKQWVLPLNLTFKKMLYDTTGVNLLLFQIWTANNENSLIFWMYKHVCYLNDCVFFMSCPIMNTLAAWVVL